jgi:ornithine carbamoyltransferase
MISPEARDAALALAEARHTARLGIKPRSFLSITDVTPAEIRALIVRGLQMKADPAAFAHVLQGKTLALLFQKTSTRTRCSFEQGAHELGAVARYIDWQSSNFTLSDLEDEARVLSRYADIIVARVKQNQTLQVMAAHSEVPVINGLCDQAHPCQALADFLTLSEYYGTDLAGLTVAWIGDGNNVCRSLVHAATALGVRVRLSSPPGYHLDTKTLASSNGLATYAATPHEAVAEADAIYTDTWISMGQESEKEERLRVFLPYQVNADLMAAAPAHTLVMHCLPAKPGYEITPEVLRSPRSVVFDQAENRTHAQKAVLEWLAG